MKNLEKRGAVWYWRETIAGRRYYESLRTGDASLAARMASAKRKAVLAADIEALQQSRVRRVGPTIGQCIEVYERSARSRGLRPATVRTNVACLRRVVQRGMGVSSVDGVPVNALDARILRAYRDHEMDRTEDPDRCRRTIASTIRQSRAVFPRWAREEMRDLGLPDLRGFLEASVVRAPVNVYELPPADLIDRTLAAGRGLRGDQPDLYAIWLLCYDLGMRAREAAAARWDWIVERDGQRLIELVRRPGWAPKGRERAVPLHAMVWDHLQEVRTKSEWICRGESESARYRRIMVDFAAWMRGLGWDQGRWPKAAHELRKLAGSRWYTELGPAVAQEWLGHVDIGTTCRFYARLRSTPQPLPMDGC